MFVSRLWCLCTKQSRALAVLLSLMLCVAPSYENPSVATLRGLAVAHAINTSHDIGAIANYIPGVGQFVTQGQTVTMHYHYTSLQNTVVAISKTVNDQVVFTSLSSVSPYGQRHQLLYRLRATQHAMLLMRLLHNYTARVGQWKNPLTDLTVMGGYRAYQSTLKRFLLADTDNTFDNVRTRNAYAYDNGNPVFFSDPSGHDAEAKLRHPPHEVTAANTDMSVVKHATRQPMNMDGTMMQTHVAHIMRDHVLPVLMPHFHSSMQEALIHVAIHADRMSRVSIGLALKSDQVISTFIRIAYHRYRAHQAWIDEGEKLQGLAQSAWSNVISVTGPDGQVSAIPEHFKRSGQLTQLTKSLDALAKPGELKPRLANRDRYRHARDLWLSNAVTAFVNNPDPEIKFLLPESTSMERAYWMYDYGNGAFKKKVRQLKATFPVKKK